MTDPTRLIEDDVTDFERLLLDSGHREEPAEHLQTQMLGHLSATGAAATASTVGLSVKWIIGLAGGALMLGGIWFSRGSASSFVEAPRVPVSVQAAKLPDEVAAPLPSLSVDLPESNPAQKAERTGEPPSATKKLSRAPSSQKVSGAGSSTLSAEVAVLERARAALYRRDASRALSIVVQYRTRFPSGSLAQEATVIEVKALELRGENRRASRLTDEFIKRHPESAHRQRLEDGAASEDR